MTVDILISTINTNINNVPSVLLKARADVSYIISIQEINNVEYNIPDVLKQRKDVSIFLCKEKGLSMNRNNCIKHASSDICIIADDDVKYKDFYIDKIKNEFIKDPSLDVFAGKIKTNIGEPEFRNYKNYKNRINFFNFKNVCSIEIAFRKKQIIENKLYFDSNFGLGSTRFSIGGEESIFIKDCLNKKLNIFFFPVYMVNHKFESSGSFNLFDITFQNFLGAYSKRVFGKKGFFLFFYFCFRYRNDLKSTVNFYKSFLKGFKY